MLVRVVIDTCVVRNHIHAFEPMLDLEALDRSKDVVRVSLADNAFVELVEQVVTKDLDITLWGQRIEGIRCRLDERWPVLPHGRPLAVLAKLQSDLGDDVEEDRLLSLAGWELLSTSKCDADLERSAVVRMPDGSGRKITIDPEIVKREMKEVRRSWIKFIDSSKANQNLANVSGIRRELSKTLGVESQDAPDLRRKLEPAVSVLATFVSQALASKGPYNPEGKNRRGDAFDITLPYYLPLPAIVCTADKKFLNRLQDTGASGAEQVVSIEQLNNHLRSGTLSSLLSKVRSAEDQQREWEAAAYQLWEMRGRPLWDAGRDWHEAEPIA